MSWRAALTSCVVTDRDDHGRFLATGKDFLDLLNRLSTNAVADLAAGDGAVTVVTSPKGRIVQRLFVHHAGDDGVLCTTGPGRVPGVLDHFRRFTFGEDTGLADVSEARSWVALVGPRSREAIGAVGLEVPEPRKLTRGDLDGHPVWVLGQDGVSDEGVSVLAPSGHRDAVRVALESAARSVGGGPAGDAVMTAWRIARGHGADGTEYNENHNPLEAGLLDAVAFDKGCYVGQEVVARLNTYDKVARRLTGMTLPPGTPPPPTGTRLFSDGRDAGTMTSACVPPEEDAAIALAFVRKEFLDPGTALHVSEPSASVVAKVVALPMALPTP